MYQRIFDPLSIDKSYFLLGPRQTGKSTLLRNLVPEDHYIDLLNPSLFVELSGRPETLLELITAAKSKKNSPDFFVIDEIQKLPKLLDTVQYLLGNNKNLRFILTGSSARRLRQAGQNLLGGRARKIIFSPLTLRELNQREKNPLAMGLKYGGLPGVRTSANTRQELSDYIGVYLNEEVMAEALVRNIGNFSRFLSVAGLCNTQQLNYEKIGSDAQIPGRTVKDYFDILEDTFIGSRLEPYRPRKDRKFVSTPKFYFFDVGVAHFINKKTTENLSPTELGAAFEHLIYCEIKAYLSYCNSSAELYFWRMQTGSEVDFVIRDENEELIGIEVKLTKTPNDRDLKGLRNMETEVPLKRKILICNTERSRRTEDHCEIVPVMKFVELLWSKSLF